MIDESHHSWQGSSFIHTAEPNQLTRITLRDSRILWPTICASYDVTFCQIEINTGPVLLIETALEKKITNYRLVPVYEILELF